MRGKRRNRSDILIDLTSLLDVIFIILLIVVCNQKNLTNVVAREKAVATEEIEQAMVEKERAQAEYELYKDQIDIESNSDMYVCVISVNSNYEPETVTQRHILVLCKGEEIESIDLIGNDTEEALEEFRNLVTGYVETNIGRPVILSLNEDDEKILYRDEKAIREIFEELGDKYDNVYLK